MREQHNPHEAHGSSPLMNAAASGGGRLRKEFFDRRALDHASLVQVDHLIPQAPRLAEVVGGHHDLGPGAVEGADHGLDLARRGGVETRGGLVEEQHLGMQRPGARQREALLLAAGEDARRAVRDMARGPLRRAPRLRDALGIRRRGDVERVAARSASAERRSITGRWNTIACLRGASRRPRTLPDDGASRPCIRRISTLLPAPFAPRMMVLGPASISQRQRLDDVEERNLLELQRQASSVAALRRFLDEKRRRVQREHHRDQHHAQAERERQVALWRSRARSPWSSRASRRRYCRRRSSPRRLRRWRGRARRALR